MDWASGQDLSVVVVALVLLVEGIEDLRDTVVARAFGYIAWDLVVVVVEDTLGHLEAFERHLDTFVTAAVGCRHFVGMVVELRTSEDIGAATLVASDPKEVGLDTFLVEEASEAGYS